MVFLLVCFTFEDLLFISCVFCLHVYLRTACLSGASRGQKRVLESLVPVTDGCESPCGLWELNIGPLEG